MIRDGIIHAGLAGFIAGLRHTETFVIADAGLPLGDVPTVDLGYRYGAPRFADVLSTVLPQVVVEASWVSLPIQQANPPALDALRAEGLEPEPIDHEEFKARVLAARFAVRTGEATLYANVLLRAGVGFPGS
jgi:D-ribose pyranase